MRKSAMIVVGACALVASAEIAEARCRGFVCAFARGAAEAAGRHVAEQALGGGQGHSRTPVPSTPAPCRPVVTCRVLLGPCGLDAFGRYGCIRREVCASGGPCP